jgi:hypothetical protein
MNYNSKLRQTASEKLSLSNPPLMKHYALKTVLQGGFGNLVNW